MATEEILVVYKSNVENLSSGVKQVTEETRKLGNETNKTQKVVSDSYKKQVALIEATKKSIAQLQVNMTKAQDPKILAGMNKALANQVVNLKKLEDGLKGVEKQSMRAKNNLTQLTETTKKSAESTSHLSSKLKTLGAVVATAFGVTKLIQFGREAVELAGKAQGVEKAFARLNNPNLLAELRKATYGTVSDLELMRQAVVANNFNIPLERLGDLFNFAKIRARETGESVEYLVNSIVVGIARKSPLILDNLGINVARVRDEMVKTGDFAKAAFNIVNQELAKSGQLGENALNTFSSLSASFENLKKNVGNLLLGPLVSLSKLMTSISDGIKNAFGTSATEQLQKQQRDFQALEIRLRGLNVESEERVQIIKQLQREYPGMLDNINAETVSSAELAKGLEQINKSYILRIALVKNQEELAEASEKLSENAVKQAKAQRDVELELARILNTVSGAYSERNKLKLDGLPTDIAVNELLNGRIVLEKVSRESLKELADLNKKSQQAQVGYSGALVEYNEITKETNASAELLNKTFGVTKKTTESGLTETTGLIEKLKAELEKLKAEQEKNPDPTKVKFYILEIKRVEAELDRLLGKEKELKEAKEKHRDDELKLIERYTAKKIELATNEFEQIKTLTDEEFTELYKIKKDNLQKEIELDLLNSGAKDEDIDKELREQEIFNLKDIIDRKKSLNQITLDDELELARLIREKRKREQEEAQEDFAQKMAIMQKYTNALFEAQQRQFDNSQAMREKEIDSQDKNLQRQQDRFDKGLTNTLAFEQRKSAELELQQKREAEKQKQIKKLETFYNTFAQASKTEKPAQALLQAFDAIAFLSIGDALFAEEGGYVGDITSTTPVSFGERSFSSGRKHGSGDRMIIASPKEGILNEKEMGIIGGRQGFYDLRKAIKNQQFTIPQIPKELYSNNTGMVNVTYNNAEVLAELKATREAIKNIPKQTLQADEMGNLISQIETNLSKKTTIHKRRSI